MATSFIRYHTDYSLIDCLDLHNFANDIIIARKLVLSHSVAEYDDGLSANVLNTWIEAMAHQRLYASDLK